MCRDFTSSDWSRVADTRKGKVVSVLSCASPPAYVKEKAKMPSIDEEERWVQCPRGPSLSFSLCQASGKSRYTSWQGKFYRCGFSVT